MALIIFITLVVYNVIIANCKVLATNSAEDRNIIKLPVRNYSFFHETRDAKKHLEDDDDFDWRIVDGELVPIEAVPYQVLYGSLCGGTLIAPNWVLTVAHCPTSENIYAGSPNRSTTRPYRIRSHFVHPNFKQKNRDYDFQLLLLDQPVPVTPRTRPIAIGSVDDIKDGAIIGVSGWGYLAFTGSELQEYLRRVFVPIISFKECNTKPRLQYQLLLAPRMFCAGYPEGKKDACRGDSGGPAVLNGKLVGLVSTGVGCARPNQPGIYANVPLVRDWIRQVTKLPL